MIRVAAYCRVSTDKTDQTNSFNSQKSFFGDYIASRPNWILAEIYADEGITGTMTDDRAGFLKMIDDASRGNFDMIITKEVSRFSRNILDAISFTRKLKAMGVGVYFLNDGISTLDSDAELRLGIMASVAQEESRKTSERVKWGQRRKMEQGVVFGRNLLGYNVENGKLAVEPVGAETVRQIFRMYISERMGVRAIAETLTRSKVLTKSGNSKWSGAVILKIIRNEKYCGDLVQRKTITTDFLTHKKQRNCGEDLIYTRDHHQPIITRVDWEAAQAELRRRAPSIKNVESNGNRYALSGRIFCSGCRSSYHCRTRKRKDGSVYRVWLCSGCMCQLKQRQVREDNLIQCVRYITMSYGRDQLMKGLDVAIKKMLRYQDASITGCEKEIAVLESKNIRLIDTYLTGDVDQEEYLFFKTQFKNDLDRLSEMIERVKAPEMEDRVTNILQKINILASGTDADGEFYLSLVEKIDIINNEMIEIHLKNVSGIWKILYNK